MLSGAAESRSFSRNSKVSSYLTKSVTSENEWFIFVVRCELFSSCPTDEMKTFAGQQIEPLFQFSWLVVFLTLLVCGSVSLVLGFTVDHKLAIAVSLSLLGLLYIFFGEANLKQWDSVAKLRA